ncbi:hypothetical protein H1R20_g11890, partial [Candolleomyces eurysporus]
MTSSEVPDTQKAWVSVRRGPPRRSLELKEDWPVLKTPQANEVLVKIKAAGLNPVGHKFMKLLPNWIAKRPHVAEFDFSGTVADAHESKDFSVGDEVYGWIWPLELQKSTKQGALSEYIRIPESHIVKRPSNITPIEAAGISLAGLTALQALDAVKLEEGQTIFINGGSTAVGSFAIQLAKLRGAKVVVTASGKNEEYVRKLGADEFIDYTKVGPLHTFLGHTQPPATKYNVVFEAVGLFDPSLYSHSSKYLAPNGLYISVGPQPWNQGFHLNLVPQGLRLIGALGLPSFVTGIKSKFLMVAVHNSVEDNKRLQTYLSEGKVKPLVDSVFKFDDALSAYDRIVTSRATGKVIVQVDPSL